MTEEDTFLRLKRNSLSEMFDLWLLCPLPACSPASTIPQEVDDFFKQYGWNYREWAKAYYKHRGN